MKKITTYLILCYIPLFINCSYIQKKIDIYHIKNLADDIINNFDPGNPDELEKFIKTAALSELTKPIYKNKIEISSFNKWKLDHPDGIPLISEEMTFPSMIEHSNKNDRALFYIYRQGDLKGRNVILWVPGMGVSNLAFRFIKNFFREELIRDYDIVFYVLPYHLARTEDGRNNGEGFLTSGTLRNIKLILDCVRELRTASEYLREMGVNKISGWGGSIGATILLLASEMVTLDHLCVMIPVLDLNSIAMNKKYMGKVTAKFYDSGFNDHLLRKAYDFISPVNHKINIAPGRMQILYAKYDQLTTSDMISAFAERNGIKNISMYDRGHATILLTTGMYNDYGRFLDSLK